VAVFCEHGNKPSGSIKKAGCFLESRVIISFSNNILHHGVSRGKKAYDCRKTFYHGSMTTVEIKLLFAI
jgi:hypothetical protein